MLGTENIACRANDPRDLLQKRLRMLNVLKHLDADCLIELLVQAGKSLRSSRPLCEMANHAAPAIVSSRDSLLCRSIDAPHAIRAGP